MIGWCADPGRAPRLSAWLLGAAAALVPFTAVADDRLPLGDWEAEGTRADIETRLHAIVEAAAQDLSTLLRPLARELLRRAVHPCGSLRVWTEGETVGVQCDDQVPAVAVPDGRAVSYTGRDGRTHQLVMEQGPDGLVQRFITPRGSRTSRFVLDGETLRVEVALEAPRLPEPLHYTITYR